jgi:hypothetical protein
MFEIALKGEDHRGPGRIGWDAEEVLIAVAWRRDSTDRLVHAKAGADLSIFRSALTFFVGKSEVSEAFHLPNSPVSGIVLLYSSFHTIFLISRYLQTARRPERAS